MGLRTVKGNGGLKRMLRDLPRTMAADVAKRSAPELTNATQTAFTGYRTVYGDARPLSVEGKPLDLRRTGAVAEQLRFDVTGTVVRVVLGPKWSKYLIGKYGILPNGAMPQDFRDRIAQQVAATRKPEL